jgi:arsenite/tail-anchored protein-transporting ATPase
VTELAFFIGKGGVGKTTLSSAYAVRLASSSRQKVLLVSTDPAHSLADILETSIGGRPKHLALGRNRALEVWQLDSEKLFREFLRVHRAELVQTLEGGTLFTRDEISSLLDSALPGMAEISALLAIHDAVQSGRYSTVVVDTAPFGHTLRLFEMPEQFTKLLDVIEVAAERDQLLAAHFGGRAARQTNPFVSKWRESLTSLGSAFAKARLFLVTTPERFALNESNRCIRELQKSNSELQVRAVVLNRAITKPGRCVACRRRADATQKAKALLRKKYKNAAFHIGEDPGFPILGAAQLKNLGEAVFGNKPLRLATKKVAINVSHLPQMTAMAWPLLQKPLTFILGKGGVGKTTISAGLGYHARRNSDCEVEICSVDPAPSLDDIFNAPVGDQPKPVLGDKAFRASELESVALFRHWVADVRAEVESSTSSQQSSIHVDLSYERRLFSDLLEIVPPGVDEVLAVFRIVEMVRSGRHVIIDMAPTAHALELLRMPEKVLTWSRLLLKSLASHRKLALARETAVKIAELEVRARELSQLLASSETAVYVVMLPEPLPDRETARLLEELRKLKLVPEAVFVNRVVSGGEGATCERCRGTATWQASVLRGLKRRSQARAVYAIPAFDDELVGKDGLRELTSEIWQLG